MFPVVIICGALLVDHDKKKVLHCVTRVTVYAGNEVLFSFSSMRPYGRGAMDGSCHNFG